MKRTPAWSYSSLKTYETCPRKYQAEKVTKEVAFTDNEATLYGKELHLAAEEYIRDDKPIDPRFSYIKNYLDKLKAIPGQKFCELKVGVKKNDGRLVACDFFDPDVWFRGVADLVIIDGEKAYIVDYKTSKNSKYADTRQLALMAAALFLKYPEIKKIKTSLLFVVPKEFIKEDFKADWGLSIFSELNGLLEAREASYTNDVWNPRPNGLCARWCGVNSCPHNGRS
jgi:CRISPR/Cas system-associated exonuclease Cas4 (RecB family)